MHGGYWCARLDDWLDGWLEGVSCGFQLTLAEWRSVDSKNDEYMLESLSAVGYVPGRWDFCPVQASVERQWPTQL